MADEARSSLAASNFECTYCNRKFTKKEHLKRHERAHTGAKPFKCAICQRSFSRGDVLTRHIRGHREAAQPRNSPLSNTENRPSLHLSYIAAGHGMQERSFSLPSAGQLNLPPNLGDFSDDQRYNSTSEASWSSAFHSAERLIQHDGSSSLLWPDSEDLFQSLMSAEGVSWAQSVPVFIPTIPQDTTPSARVARGSGQVSREELAAAEDGHRAVQTVNGLLTNTLFDVTSHVELSDLTPRFLDSSLHMFFVRLVPILPVIHRPTFVYRACSATLLLNAIALGSLFLGTEDATAKGEALWRLAYTAIATSWSEMIGQRRDRDTCSGVELVLTALLSQTYAALSKNRTLRMTSQTFYGLSMHWSQYSGMYDASARPHVIPRQDDTMSVKMDGWKSWAAQETQLRTLLGLCVIDGVASQFSGNLVNTWSATKSLPLACREDIFAAATVDEWIDKMRIPKDDAEIINEPAMRFSDLQGPHAVGTGEPERLTGLRGLLNIKVMLEILSSLATDLQRTNQTEGGPQRRLEVMKTLNSFRQEISLSTELSAADRTIGLLRWHAICLDLVVSTARGARRMCYHYGITQSIFGGKKRQEPTRIDPEGWARGVPARKCLLHALEIHRLASEVPLGVIHDTSLPGALFAAATTYSSFALPGVSKIVVPASVHWESVLIHGLDNVQDDAMPSLSGETGNTLSFLRNNLGSPKADWIARNLLYELSSIRILLHSLSQHWGVTQEMEEVIGAWEARCS
ncbi:hypothetical protein BDP55DRAFT_721395 [Colletotrichum godetiae]|uniref:C2H2-type domain-containing protein n=1 Tax=Colletotrichum godetiae TaxID=1209918 RepID=A0AAJ0A9G2_9PEZI|nr:uncharacterized protein BDP55DRAFT_721395 [Colletotrichum godetiae]KAK1657457.1 hypothetical protein BDP55DRAFT_721395 [Colletotrichum godetiae]